MKYFVPVLIFLGVIILGVAGYTLLASATLNINPSPRDSVIMVDNQMVSSGQTRVTRGTHKIEVAKTDYATNVYSVSIWGGQTKEIAAKLTPLPKAVSLLDNSTTLDISADNKSLLTAGNQGRTFYEFQLSTNEKTAISKLDFGQVKRVKWSPNRELAYIWREDGDSGMVDFKRYDLVNQEYKSWGKDNLDLAWSPTGDEVVYIYKPGSGEVSLMKSDLQNNNKERLADLRQITLTNPTMEWASDNKKLIIFDKNIYIFDFYTKEIKPLTSNGEVVFGRLSPNDNIVAYTTKTGLYRVDFEGQSKQVGAPLARFSWQMGNILGFRDGGLVMIDPLGRETNYGYTGDRLAEPEDMIVTKSGSTAYFLINNKIYGLFLQPKITPEITL